MSPLGLGVFFGMVGYPFFLVLMAVPLGLRPQLFVLLGGILPVCFLNGGYLLILMLRVRLEELLRNLMFGLMVVWLMTGCLVFLLLGLALLTGLVGFGLIGSRVIGMMMLVMVLLFLLVVVSAQFLGLCKLFKGMAELLGCYSCTSG